MIEKIVFDCVEGGPGAGGFAIVGPGEGMLVFLGYIVSATAGGEVAGMQRLDDYGSLDDSMAQLASSIDGCSSRPDSEALVGSAVD